MWYNRVVTNLGELPAFIDYYDKELINTGQRILQEDILRQMIDRLYHEKAGELKKYIK